MFKKPFSVLTNGSLLLSIGVNVGGVRITPNAYTHAVLMEPLDEREDGVPLLSMLVQLITSRMTHVKPRKKVTSDLN